jgi:signal transduction histidine kinase
MPEMQTRSELAVPIQHGEDVLGVLNLESDELNAFSEGDGNLLQAIADQVAMALDNARLFQEVKVQRDEAMAVTESLFNLTDQVVSMNRVATALLSTNDLDEVAHMFVESLRDEMGVQKSGLWMVDGDLMRLAAAVGLPACALSEVWGEACTALLEVGQTAKYLRRRQFTGETCCDLYFDDWFMLPVKAHNEVLGVLVTEAGALEDDTLRMFINQAALGLSAARAYRRLSEQAEVLAQTNRELARAIQSKTNLLNFMSHEVRNPLTAIIGFAKLLQKERVGPLNKKQCDFIARILTGSQHMASLVSEVLDLSKAEAGKLSIHIESIPVADILADAVNIVSGRAAEKDIKIAIDAPDPPVLVQADPTRLRQVLLNLLTNAIKFTGRQGSIVVGAAARTGPEGGPEVVIRVSDTGIGIKEADFPKVFGEFDQIEDERTRSEVGTGLGLPLTKELVELHHGRIWFESTYGEGTTFFVALPAASQ